MKFFFFHSSLSALSQSSSNSVCVCVAAANNSQYLYERTCVLSQISIQMSAMQLIL